jgi:hypothetical protein
MVSPDHSSTNGTSDHFTVSSEAICQKVSGEMVILDLNSESYFGLNETGCRIWQLLEAGYAIPDILQTLTDEFDVSRQELETDLQALLDALEAAGLIQQAEAAKVS